MFTCDFSYQFRDSIVASIPACHAGDRGSIPRRGENFVRCGFKMWASLLLPSLYQSHINASPWYFVLASSNNNNKQTPDIICYSIIINNGECLLL